MDFDMQRRALRLAQVLAGIVMAVGCVVLLGYAFGLPMLIRIHPRLQGMAPLTAASLVFTAWAVMMATRGRDRAVQIALLLPIVVIGAVIVGHLVEDRDVVDPWFAQLVFGTVPADSGRMSTGTAIALLLVVLGIAARERSRWSDFAAGAALLLAATALLGFVYGVDDLYALPVFRTMGLHTAASLVLLSVATLLTNPASGWSAVVLSKQLGGRVTRRQLALLLLPALVGWLLHEGTVVHRFGTAAALTLLVILTFAPMALLVLRDGRLQLALDAERRRNASAQDELARDLERRLARKAEQLEHESTERSKMEAAIFRTQRVEAIGQLTGGIAHDFNNLLAAIGGNLELLLRKLPEDHLARRHAVTAASAVGKGAKLAGQLLAFSRSQRLAIQSLELVPALKRTRELIGSSLGPSIDVSLEYPRDGIWVLTDPDQLELALFNLAVNARDAMPDGGQLRIEGGVRITRIDGGADDRSYVSIRVIDNGTGMTPEVASKAIEPFFTTRERGKGTGLGLAQVYGFVRQCEGDLLIESEPGRGTTIEMLLPMGARPVIGADGAEPVRPRAVKESVARRRLLVVDDDDAVRGVLVELLMEAGYDVVEANDGASALARLEQIAPDGAVIDFLMPGINGAEVARRARSVFPRLPVVFVSGYSDTVALQSVRDAVVLRKPFQGEHLQAAVESAFATAH